MKPFCRIGRKRARKFFDRGSARQSDPADPDVRPLRVLRLIFAATLALSVFCLAALAGASPALAQAALSAEAVARDKEIVAAARDLSELAERINAGDPKTVQTSDAVLRDLIAGGRARLAAIEGDLRRVSSEIDLLGLAPGENDPPEASSVADQRSRLVAQVGALEGQRRRTLANLELASALLTRVSQRRIVSFYAGLLERGPGLIDPRLWTSAAVAASGVGDKFEAYFQRWDQSRDPAIDDQGRAFRFAVMASALVLAILIFGPATRIARRSISGRFMQGAPTEARRLTLAGLTMMARLSSAAVGGIVVIAAARSLGLIDAAASPVIDAIWRALMIFAAAEGFASGFFGRAAARDCAAQWALAPVDPGRATQARALIVSYAAIFALVTVMTAIGVAVDTGASADRLLRAVGAGMMGLTLFLGSAPRFWASPVKGADPPGNSGADDSKPPRGKLFQHVRPVLRAASIVIVIAALVGFVALAEFLSSRVLFLGLAAAAAWFLRAIANQSVAWIEQKLVARAGCDGRSAAKGESDEDSDVGAFSFWTGLVIDVVLFIVFAPIILFIIGVDRQRIYDIVQQAFIGIRIGGVTISFAEIAAALIVFAGVLIATRLFRTALDKGPLAHSRIDPGVRNSLTTLIGYLGLILAIFMSVTTLGFDLSNLALIAGALSVGVGFGLQSIVNNFVSGLILLFERPVKVGDWIVTTSGEGIVKKISVRSTEIETFDRSTIIVPNSELISSTVTNWTHKDKLGRIIIKVGVAYESDPEKVREVMLKCANDHPLIVRFPEPFVVFLNFGDSSLDFEIRAFVRDIGTGLRVRTDLRFAIVKAFREAGIEIPFPQRDVHIRSIASAALPLATAAAAAPEPSPQSSTMPAHEQEDPGDIAPDD